MFDNVLLLIMGMFLLIKGADWFVGGASAIAKALKIPSLIIGLTLVSLGTSLPEASVSIQSSLNGSSALSLGNVVGSNIVNTLLILGLCALFVPIAIDKDMKKFDIPIMLGLYVIILLFCFVITPDVISRWQGIVLVVLFMPINTYASIDETRVLIAENSEGEGKFSSSLGDLEQYKGTSADSETLNDMAGNILGILKDIGAVLSVVIIMILGIKYMLGSVEEKAEYKKDFIPYIAGAILVFTVTLNPHIIYQFAQNF